jgi:GTP-binding protein EngB required for normal cell division
VSRRRPPDPKVAVTSLANAVELGRGRLEPDDLARAEQVVARSEGRLGHGTAHTVVALLGATGSGKSSLFNALVGTPLATTGVRRPTTARSQAAVWGDDPADGLLDWLEVPARHLVGQSAELGGLVLLDVPDHDSVAVEHRLEMERIAAHTDVLLWVTDAEKYADRAMHQYLRRLAGRDAVVLVALNKSDALDRKALDACRTDLAALLAADGLPGVSVLAVSAATGNGLPELRARLARAVSARRAALDRIAIEVREAATTLSRQVGGSGSAGVNDRARRDLLDGLADAAGASSVEAAVAAGYRRDAQTAAGWPVTRWVGQLRPHPLRRFRLQPGSTGRSSRPAPPAGQQARAGATIRNVAEQAAAGLPEPWPTVLRRAASPDPTTLHDRLDQAIGRAIRRPSRTPTWWRVFGLAQIVLAAAALAGAVWLVALFVVAWLQLPDPPLPELGPFPVPTIALAGGLLLGWLLALLARRLAAVGARRRAAAARRSIRAELEAAADELVLTPLREELRQREALVVALRAAGA